MPWAALLGALGFNLYRHRHGQSTLCSSTRPHVTPAEFAFAWGVLSGWLIPHYAEGVRYVQTPPAPTQ